MPLKLVRRPKSPYWVIRGTLRGIRVEESTGIAERGPAEEILAKRAGEILQTSIHGRRATATFAEAALSYLENGGSRRFLDGPLGYFGTTALARIDQDAIEAGAKKTYPKASPATRSRQWFTPVSAVLHHAALKGWCPKPIIARPAGGDMRYRWLRPEEAERLIAAASPYFRPLVIFLLYTGARAAEAVWLDWKDVDLAGAQVTFSKTKTDKPRSVPLVPRVVAALANLKGRDGCVFRKPSGKPYEPLDPEDDADTSAGKRIRKAFAGAVERAGLGAWVPHPQKRKSRRKLKAKRRHAGERFLTDVTPHVTRHTWATWHYQANRDLGALQHLGGWSSVHMVLRYAHTNVAHLAPTMIGLPGGELGDTHTAEGKTRDAS
jgi:integrase